MSADNSIIHVERQVLHTAMQRASSLQDMPLLPKHFSTEQHADLWQIIQSLDLDAKPFDAVSVMDAASKAGLSKATQSLSIEIAGAAELYPVSDPSYPAGRLIKGWRNREAARIARQLIVELGTREDGAADRAIAALMGLHAEDASCEHTAKQALQLAYREVLAAHEAGGRLIGVPTGLRGLDDTLGGLHNSDLVVIGARPALGKTGMLLGMAAEAGKHGPAGLVSGEQGAAQVGLRWMAGGSGVAVGKLRAAQIEDEQWAGLQATVARFTDRPIHILDRSGPDITEVIRVARRWRHQYGIKALYVDYLQRLEIASMVKAPKHEKIGAIARALKNLARDLDIPVVVLAQVSRDAEGLRPQMNHLSDSSEIEKEADQIMMLWRDTSAPGAAMAPAEINVVKNRHGNVGVVHCLWHGASTSFVDEVPDTSAEGSAA